MNLAETIRDEQHQDANAINAALDAVLAANGDVQQIAMVLSNLFVTAYSTGHENG